MASWTEDLLVGLAEYLAAHTPGVWKPNGGYSASEAAIVLGWSPPELDQLIILTPYQPGPDDSGTDTVQHVQVKCRGAADGGLASVLALRDPVLDALHGLAWVHIGGVRIQQIRHQSGVELPGVDQSNRHETTDNYRAQAVRMSAYRTE
ncbi:minor capsid protein [Glycomyces sp. NPDC046736]|uniref:minor capsid protein n=1 Tax=Glycomyces sp. NPDC046736 TaxID=3155615 RepID=UPI00340AEE43